ncbi:MAG: hypothetical protein ACO3C1_10270 [Ilumatobacteraceae bacterium]
MWADRAHDERRHVDAAVETWVWWGSEVDGAGSPLLAWFVGVELRGRRFDYWAGLARRDVPYLYVEELDGTGLRDGLELKPPEMWAGHDCDVPFGQWSLGNEAHGVLLDDADDALRRAFGERAPITTDIEWYAAGEPEVLDLTPGADGYRQRGDYDARFETADGVVASVGSASRVHVWGTPWRPAVDASMPTADTLRGSLHLPYRRADGTGIVQVVTADGWWARTVHVQ